MAKTKKSTKKFAPKLKGVIKQRKERQRKNEKGKRRMPKPKVQTDDADEVKESKSVDDFLDSFLEGDDSGEEQSDTTMKDVVEDGGEEEKGEDDDEDNVEEEEELLTLQEEVEQHKRELDRLKETDPSFYEYLQKEGQDLLEFGDDAEMEDAEEVEEEDKQENEEEEEVEAPAKADAVNKKQIEKWEEEALHGSIKALKKLVKAFHSASIMASGGIVEVGGQKNENMSGAEKRRQKKKNRQKAFFEILTAETFDAAIRVGLTEVPELIIRAAIGDKEFFSASKGEARDDATKKLVKKVYSDAESQTSRWMRIRTTCNLYSQAFMHLLSGIKESKPLKAVLYHMQDAIPVLIPLKGERKRLLTAICSVWASEGRANLDNTSAESAATPQAVGAYTVLKRMALCATDGFESMVLKFAYLAYIRNAAFTNRRTLPVMQFMSSCFVQLCGIDFAATYQHAFVNLRQIAVFLRTALKERTKASYQAVYGWKSINGLRLWGSVITAYPTHPDVQLLVYPLSQLLTGLVRLIPTPRYFPLRFNCIRILNSVAKSTNTYIPTAQLLLDVFPACLLKNNQKPYSGKILDFACSLLVAESQLHTIPYMTGCVKQAAELLLEHFAIHACHPSFPELFFAIGHTLRRFMKRCKLADQREPVKELLQKLEENAKWMTEQRKQADIAPKDMQRVSLLTQELQRKGKSPLLKHYRKMEKLRRDASGATQADVKSS